MNTTGVEADLATRIAQTRQWFEDGSPEPIQGMLVRGRKCLVFPDQFVDAPKRRSEKHGARFRLEIETGKETREALVEVRIMPECSPSMDGDGFANPPYVSIYAIDPDSYAGDEITHTEIGSPKNYADATLALGISDWYAYWLKFAFAHKKVAKLFKNQHANS